MAQKEAFFAPQRPLHLELLRRLRRQLGCHVRTCTLSSKEATEGIQSLLYLPLVLLSGGGMSWQIQVPLVARAFRSNASPQSLVVLGTAAEAKGLPGDFTSFRAIYA